MLENKLDLKPIQALLNESFLIPSYQRGYRWTKEQVNALLDDIWEFTLKDRKREEIYCLQPIVVKKNKSSWEVIDGQQRLTTIHIILSYLYRRLNEQQNVFQISYQSREGSELFLNSINQNDADKNIDYYHMWQALTTVEKWFAAKGSIMNSSKIFPVLLENTMMIWYEINDNNTNPIEIFTRINIGKIPLTDSELVKALFLKSENFVLPDEHVQESKRVLLKQLEIAGEWDRMEYTLQDNSFWYFLTKSDPPNGPRISFLLDVIANTIGNENNHYTFNHFYKLFSERLDSETLPEKTSRHWLMIKRFFMTLEEWYIDRELYHLVGYLFAADSLIPRPKNFLLELQRKSMEKTKEEFKIYLRNLITQYVAGEIEILKYQHRIKVKNVLLLFNIEFLMKNRDNNARFQFERYKTENWDIEHIHAVKSRMPEQLKHQKEWLLVLHEEMGDKLEEGLRKRTQNFLDLEGKSATDSFEKIFNDILDFYNKNDNTGNINEIGNLALLDASTNRKYKNAIFPIKRKVIINRDEQGVFIPICTKNVFLKHYTENPDQLTVWSSQDRDAYKEKIKNTLKSYLVC